MTRYRRKLITAIAGLSLLYISGIGSVLTQPSKLFLALDRFAKTRSVEQFAKDTITLTNKSDVCQTALRKAADDYRGNDRVADKEKAILGYILNDTILNYEALCYEGLIGLSSDEIGNLSSIDYRIEANTFPNIDGFNFESRSVYGVPAAFYKTAEGELIGVIVKNENIKVLLHTFEERQRLIESGVPVISSASFVPTSLEFVNNGDTSVPMEPAWVNGDEVETLKKFAHGGSSEEIVIDNPNYEMIMSNGSNIHVGNLTSENKDEFITEGGFALTSTFNFYANSLYQNDNISGIPLSVYPFANQTMYCGDKSSTFTIMITSNPKISTETIFKFQFQIMGAISGMGENIECRVADDQDNVRDITIEPEGESICLEELPLDSENKSGICTNYNVPLEDPDALFTTIIPANYNQGDLSSGNTPQVNLDNVYCSRRDSEGEEIECVSETNAIFFSPSECSQIKTFTDVMTSPDNQICENDFNNPNANCGFYTFELKNVNPDATGLDIYSRYTSFSATDQLDEFLDVAEGAEDFCEHIQ